jgi:RNA polymerase sigma factor (TIGR02999 family)
MPHSSTPHDPTTLAALRTRAEAGDSSAKDALFTALYDELHRLAQAHLHRGGGNVTLGATTLLHEAYLDIAQRSALAFPDQNRFLGYASRAMRTLVIDYVRQRGAQKRGGNIAFTTLADQQAGPDHSAVTLERLDTALVELSTVDAPLAELVDLKFFCGFSFSQIAAMRGMSERTVQRDWVKARALLRHMLVDT